MAAEEQEESAPLWVMTFADLMNLLLTFFILLVSLSSIREPQEYKQAADSIQQAFGIIGGMGGSSEMPPELQGIQEMQRAAYERFRWNLGQSVDQGASGRYTSVRRIRDGLEFTLGGPVSFQEGQAELLPEAQEDLRLLAGIIRGYNNKVDVRGHTSKVPLPAGSPFKDHLELSYARARAVRDFLVSDGNIAEQRIRVTAVGDYEPIVARAYTLTRRGQNSRVEVIVLESLVQEYDGDKDQEETTNPPAAPEEGVSHGG